MSKLEVEMCFDCAVQWDAEQSADGWSCPGCDLEEETQRRRAAEAKLNRCLEALKVIDGWADRWIEDDHPAVAEIGGAVSRKIEEIE